MHSMIWVIYWLSKCYQVFFRLKNRISCSRGSEASLDCMNDSMKLGKGFKRSEAWRISPLSISNINLLRASAASTWMIFLIFLWNLSFVGIHTLSAFLNFRNLEKISEWYWLILGIIVHGGMRTTKLFFMTFWPWIPGTVRYFLFKVK